MRRALALPWLLVVSSACFDQTIPSSFTAADAAPEARPPTEGGTPLPDASLLGDGAIPVTFFCGPIRCPGDTYCVLTEDDAGAELAQDCYPLLTCAAGDCACVSGVAGQAYCAGSRIGCTNTAGVVVTCAP